MKFCNFCARRNEKTYKISDKCEIIANKTVTILDGLKIFQNELKFIFDDLDSVICSNCLKLLNKSYEFVQQIKDAAKKLRLGRDIKNEHDYFEKEKKICEHQSQTKEVTVNENLRLGLKINSNLNFVAILPKTGDIQNSKKDIKEIPITSSRIYKCFDCTEVFKSFKHLRQHELGYCKNTCTIQGIFICKYCHASYNKEDHLNVHLTEKHINGQFLCYYCKDQYYTAKGYLTRHIFKAHHHTSWQYFCGKCSDAIESQDKLLRHFVENHPLEAPKNVLDEKPRETINDADDDMDLEMHEEFLDEFLLAHTNENSFQFSECWEALDLHLPDMLQGSSSNLANSQAFSEAFPCPKCLLQFKNPQPFIKHLAENHNLPVLICRTCRKSFAFSKDFKIHKQMKCIKNSAIDTLSPNCPYCSKTFKDSLSLKQHLRIVHTQLKRHICQLCDKQFSTLDHLKKHVLSQHQNERKHTCHVCDKTFTQLCHLKQHLEIHTTGKTLKCSECSTKFWRKIDLKRHLQKKHDIR